MDKFVPDFGELYIKTDSGAEIYIKETDLRYQLMTETMLISPSKDGNHLKLCICFGYNHSVAHMEFVKHYAVRVMLKNIKRRDYWPAFLYNAYIDFKRTSIYRILRLYNFF